jgi:hypothetical protein
MEQGCPQASDIHFISKFSLIKTTGPATTKPITTLYLEVAEYGLFHALFPSDPLK